MSQSSSLLAASMLSFLIHASTEHKIKLNMIVRKMVAGKKIGRKIFSSYIKVIYLVACIFTDI
jgi:hypothetical protein